MHMSWAAAVRFRACFLCLKQASRTTAPLLVVDVTVKSRLFTSTVCTHVQKAQSAYLCPCRRKRKTQCSDRLVFVQPTEQQSFTIMNNIPKKMRTLTLTLANIS